MPAGTCRAGSGTRIDTGIDDDDGQLDSGEIDASSYGCNGAAGERGPQGEAGLASDIAASIIAPGDVCPEGGHLVQVGLDEDRDGSLSNGEVDSQTSLCNTASGGVSATGSGCTAARGSADAPTSGVLLLLALSVLRLIRRRRAAA